MIGKNTHMIRQEALRLGFESIGFAKAMKLDEDAFRLENWLNKGLHGQMGYMENHFDKRIDPTKLVDGAKSVITLLLNYYPLESMTESNYKVSKYAWGKDYHDVIRIKLNELLIFIRDEIGEVSGRGFVDSAPVLERSWAQRSGLGWIGKNANLITRHQGSFFFIATLITDLELQEDLPTLKDYCGTCTRCIDACPTGAILPEKEIDGSRCISYYTIELKDALIQTDRRWDEWIFGCDICQDVCPWNRFSKPTTESQFKPIPEILNFSNKDWEEITEETFKVVFKESPLKRSKWKGIRRNIQFVQSKE
ncbi:MAG: tRNA epoxyqueuosine(34) reductase QueG [Chitinophagaceae bacterium]|nr:tRNA epoxyqueuosine(34) reductase QueG [Chitinophagaceae bacterium]